MVRRIIFELFSSVHPKTVKNFHYLCTGVKEEERNTFKSLHYLNTPITTSSCKDGFIVQGEDFSSGELSVRSISELN